MNQQPKQYSSIYPYFIKQTWLSGVLEAYSQTWDDIKAEELEAYYLDEMTKHLRQLVQLLSVSDEQKLEAMTLESRDKYVTIERLKKIFNPNSPPGPNQDIFWKSYRNENIENYIIFAYLEKEILQSDTLSEDKILPLFVKNDLLQTLKNLQKYDEDGIKGRYALQEIVVNIKPKLEELFSGFDIETLALHYDAWTNYGNINIDDPDTWNDSFRLFFHLKLFKKIGKSLSTYIVGNVGRGSLSIARIDDIQKPPVRLESYTQRKLKDNERYIFNTSYRENVCETKRWSSPSHVIPANSELKELYIPRAEDRILLHPDFAQNEIRCLASLVNEEGLLDALEKGLDVHKYVASRTFKKDISLITDNERKTAKSASFAILYGKSIAAFARDFMHGDLTAAQSFFEDFWAAFPKIKQFINQQHKIIMQNGWFPAFFGDPLRYDPKKIGAGQAKRNSQNAPIQYLGSMLAALGIWKLHENIQERNIRAFVNGFCHDSCDIDCYIPDVPRIIPLIKESLVTHIRESYGILVETDLEIGVSLGSMMKLKKKDEMTYTFSCPEMTYIPLIERLEKSLSVRINLKETAVEKESLKELFISAGTKQRPFSKYIGQEITYYKGELTFL